MSSSGKITFVSSIFRDLVAVSSKFPKPGETIMGGDPDFHTGFNLILCYYALGDADKMRRGFGRLISIPLAHVEDEEEALKGESKEESKDEVGTAAHADKAKAKSADGMRHELTRRAEEARKRVPGVLFGGRRAHRASSVYHAP